MEAYSQATPRPVKPLVRQHLRRATNKPHGMDDQLVTVVVDQHDEFEKTPGRIHTNQQPAPRVIFIIKWTGVQDMGGCMAHCVVTEAVTTVVLPRSLM